MLLDSFLYFFDLFKSPMYLLFDAKRKVPSPFSSFLSLGIIIFLTIFFFQSDIFSKSNEISSTQSIAVTNRPALDFTDKNMNFAIGITDYVNNIMYDPSIFDIIVYAYQYTAAGEEISAVKKTLVKCKEENFKQYGNVFKELDMQKYYCLEENNFTLEGYWDEKVIKYVDIRINKCKNDTSNNNSCKTNEEIQQFFQNDKYLNIFYTDNMIDANNYENPIKKLYKNRFFLMDGKISKKITFYFKKVEFSNDDGLIFPDNAMENSFLFGNFEVDYVSDNPDWIGTILLYSYSEIYVVTRRYQKIQEIIASLGGLANALFIIGYFLTFLEKQFIYFKTMISHTYSLEKPERRRRNNTKIEEIRCDKGVNQHRIELTIENINEISGISGNIAENYKKKSQKPNIFYHFIKEIIMKIRKKVAITFENNRKSEKFTVTFFEFLKVKYKPSCFSLSEKEKTLKTALNLYYKEIDILNIIEKLQEIDKLKEISFNQEQRKRFESLQKPNIMKKIRDSYQKNTKNIYK